MDCLFFQGKKEFSKIHPVAQVWCTNPNKIAEPFDVLLSIRAPVGAVNIADTRCCIGRGLAAIRYKSNYKFLYYYLLTSQNILNSLSTGSTFNAISGKEIKKFPFPLPPLPEQHRIVEKIEELFSDLDDGIASLKKAKEQIFVYKKSLIIKEFKISLINQKQFFSNKIDQWKETRLGEVVDCLDNRRIPVNKKDRQKRKGNVPYYGANGKVDTIDEFIFEDDLILVVEDETFTGRKLPFCYKISGKSWVNNHAHVIKPKAKDDLAIDYLNYSLWYYPFTALTTGTTGRKKLTKKALMAAQYIYPSLEIQNRILKEIESQFLIVDKMEQSIDDSLQQAEAMRQSILKSAFEGRLV